MSAEAGVCLVEAGHAQGLRDAVAGATAEVQVAVEAGHAAGMTGEMTAETVDEMTGEITETGTGAMIVGTTAEAVVATVVTACLAKHGGRVIGNAKDAEHTILPAEADAMAVAMTKPQRGVTAVGTEVTVVEEVMGIGVTEAAIEEVAVAMTEARRNSNQETGTAQTAAPITSPAVKPAINATLQSKCMSSLLLQVGYLVGWLT